METPKIPPSDINPLHRQVTLLTDKIPPPGALYISQEDAMEMSLWNSLPGLTARIVTRFLRPDGVITPTVKLFTPSSDRARNTFKIDLTEGFLLSVAVTNHFGAPLRGQTFCTVELTRGPTGAAVSHEVLIQEYIFNLSYAGWPGGMIRSPLEGPGVMRSIVGTDPAAGAEISETVPTNARWRLIAFTSTLVTSAAVANRRLRLVHDDGANIYCNAFSTLLLPASTTTTVTWGDSYPLVENTDQQITAPLPRQDMLLAGSRIRTITTNFQAGDNWAAPVYLVEEWIEP